jgi:hypothetical protein
MATAEQKLTPKDEKLFEKFWNSSLSNREREVLVGIEKVVKHTYIAGLSDGRRGALQLILEKYQPQPSLRSSTNA